MVKVAFGPRTASFAKWLVGISKGIKGMTLVRDHEVHPEMMNAFTMIYSYKSPSALPRMAGSEGLLGKPILVYQPWQSIRQELIRHQLKWKASDFCGWVRWASKVLEPTDDIELAIDLLALADVQEMMVLFPQKSCRKETMRWVGKIFTKHQTIMPLGLAKRWKDFQVVILP